MARVFIVSDHQVVRAGLRSLLTDAGEHEVVGEATLDDAAGEVTPSEAEVVVVDLGAEPEAAEDLSRLFGENPNLPLIVVGQSTSSSLVRQVFQLGAKAFLVWDVGGADLSTTIEAVRRGLLVLHPAAGEAMLRTDQAGPSPAVGGGEALTPRETEVLALLAHGLPSKTIAQRLQVSEHTVKFHIGSILTKLDAASRTEAVTIALRRGLIAL